MSRIAFVDCETTGLSLDDDIWELAAIVREEDGTEHIHHMFIKHDDARCVKLPEPFLSDHQDRYPQWGAVWQEEAAKQIAALFPSDVPMRDRPHIVGCVPNFDTERIALLLRRFGLEPGWHYHLSDVENLAVGYLAGMAKVLGDNIGGGELLARVEEWRAVAAPPWDSEEISRAVGVDPDRFDRHQALGDVKWAMAIWDAVTGRPR